MLLPKSIERLENGTKIVLVAEDDMTIMQGWALGDTAILYDTWYVRDFWLHAKRTKDGYVNAYFATCFDTIKETTPKRKNSRKLRFRG
jgi:hypothetical protein